jgi:hypothetical protein
MVIVELSLLNWWETQGNLVKWGSHGAIVGDDGYREFRDD